MFLPYYESCKSLISDNMGGVAGDSSSFNFHRMSEVPDTLYMVRDTDPREMLGALAGPGLARGAHSEQAGINVLQ